MMTKKLISLAEAAALIPDEAVVSVSSSSALGCPDAMLKAIGEHFQQHGHPARLTTLHPIAAGDMYGVKGIDYLAVPGLLKRVIAGSYPSGPSSMPSPAIWQMIYANAVEAYNLPSGILFHMHREAAARRPGVLTRIGWDTTVDPRRTGGRLNAITTEDLVRIVEFDGEEWLYFRAIPVDVTIIRGTTADEAGNISTEHEGAYLGALDQALAARSNGGIVIAQVKRLTTHGSIPPQKVRVPGTLVDYIVLDPDQKQTTQTLYEPAISGETRRPLSSFEPVEWSVQKVIARRAALELRAGETVNLGFGISALVPYILLEEDLHNQVTWVIEQGAVGGIPLLDFQFGCASNADAIIASPDQFTFFHGGGFDRTMLSFMQVDGQGSVNVSRLASKPHVTAGIGGFIDITSNARNIVFSGYFTAGGLKLDIEDRHLRILQEGQVPKFIPRIEDVTFSGGRARDLGQHVTYVTERCVLRLEPDGLTVVEIAPGIDIERDVRQQAAVPLKISENLTIMDTRLFDPAPMRLRLRPRDEF
jgi:propionate CoA-transferase